MRMSEVYEKREIDLLTLQLIAAFGFLLTVIISILLTYDKILSLSHQPRLFTEKQAQDLSHFNSILIILVVLLYLYVGYENIKLSEAQGKDPSNLYLTEFNSVLALIAAFIGYYVVTHSKQNGLSIAQTELL